MIYNLGFINSQTRRGSFWPWEDKRSDYFLLLRKLLQFRNSNLTQLWHIRKQLPLIINYNQNNQLQHYRKDHSMIMLQNITNISLVKHYQSNVCNLHFFDVIIYHQTLTWIKSCVCSKNTTHRHETLTCETNNNKPKMIQCRACQIWTTGFVLKKEFFSHVVLHTAVSELVEFHS